MLNSISLIVILSVALLIAIGYIFHLNSAIGAVTSHNMDMRTQAIYAEESYSDLDKPYSVQRFETPDACHPHEGCWAVCRTGEINGYSYRIWVKVFTDPDDQFGFMLAEELCEKLNEPA